MVSKGRSAALPFLAVLYVGSSRFCRTTPSPRKRGSAPWVATPRKATLHTAAQIRDFRPTGLAHYIAKAEDRDR